MQKGKGVFSIAFILFIIWVGMTRLGEEKAPTAEMLLASLLYFICSLPVLIYFARSEKNIPYLPIFGIFFFIYFGFTVFNNYKFLNSLYLEPAIISKCITLTIFGFISLLLAFYSILGKTTDVLARPLKISWDSRKAYRLGVFLGIFGINIYYASIVGKVPFVLWGLITFLTNLSLLGIAILFMLQLQNKLKFGSRIFLWLGLFIPKVVLDMISGSTFPVIADFMLLFFLYFYYYKSIPWSRLVIALVVFFFIFSARNDYRELTWGGIYTGLKPQQKAALYFRLIFERLSGQREQHRPTYEALSIRTDNLAILAQVVELTPQYIPYWGGYTYSTLWTTLMPRFLMPNKPQKRLGQEFGHRYMLLDPSDISTSYNLPLVVEMYINFGEVGIIVGMFILGLLFRAFYNLFNHHEAGEGGFLVSVMIFTNLLGLESDFSLMFGNILQYTILFYIIVRRMKLPVRVVKTTQ